MALAALGMMNGLAALQQTRLDRFAFLKNIIDQFAPFTLPITPFAAGRSTIAVIVSAFLILIALGIEKGKEQAWLLAIVLLPLSILLHLVKGWDCVYTLPVLFLWYCLFVNKASFRVESDPSQLRAGFALLVLGFASLASYGLLGSCTIYPRFFLFTLPDRLLSTFLHLIVHTPPGRIITLPTHLEWLLALLPWLSSFALLAGLIVLLRPVSAHWWVMHQHIHQQEQLTLGTQKASELVGRYGQQTLAFFSLAPGNLHCMTADKEGLVSYRLANNVAVALGDCICSAQAFEHVTRHFLHLCEKYDWSPAFFQVHAQHLPQYRALGLQALKIGEEAILDVQTFTLAGSAMANVRTSARRALREGVHIEWYEGLPSQALLQQLHTLSQVWLERKAGKNAHEMGFSMGRLSEFMILARRAETVAEALQSRAVPTSEIPRFLIGIATNQEGLLCAFVTFTPIYGEWIRSDNGTDQMQRWGWALDLVRRVPHAPPGIIELLLVDAIERFRKRGAHVLSLGMVALADTQQEMTNHQRQATDFISKNMHFLETHHSLFHFKQKFHPRWESRYIVSATPLSLLKCAVVLLRLISQK
jgi:phosphatidylglycerol lysyltransferase